MASKLNYESSLPTPSFSSVFKEEKSQDGWTFVDFFPELIKPAGVFKTPEYKDFRSLVDRANDWLRSNPQWEIKTCESVQFPVHGSIILSEETLYLQPDQAITMYSLGLRLWLSSRKDCDKTCQQIGYLNLVPQEIQPDGLFKSAIYERLDDIVNKYNQNINYQPLPGRIITIQTRKIKVHNKGVDPDETLWYTNGGLQNRFLYILTIFYEITGPTYEEIGFQDFMPAVIEKGGLFKSPKYEMFCYIVNKASDWCSQQTEKRIFNIQAYEMNISLGNIIDMNRTYTIENISNATCYLRVLRVAYTKSETDSKLYPTLCLPQLTCKSFIPVRISYSSLNPKFETLQETKTRVSAWIKATGAKVISAETTCLKVNFMGNGPQLNDGTTYTFSVKKKGQFWIYVIRIYLDRYYPDPPEGTLPPVPELQKSNCLIS